MAKRKSRIVKKATGIFNNPTLKKAMVGIGAGTLAGTVVGMIAPQATPFAKPVAAFLAGGPIGGIASVIADGGFSLFNQVQQPQGVNSV